MSERHKHADLIIAWANGEELDSIEYFNEGLNAWYSVDDRPTWKEDTKYRIKPEKKKMVKRWLWVSQMSEGSLMLNGKFLTDKEAETTRFLGQKVCKAPWTEMEFDE